MTRNILMVGISALAFAASAASAQTTNPNSPITQNGSYGPDTNGNRVVVSCTTDGTNNCSVNQGANGQTFNSTGSAVANGSVNTSTVDQRGNNLNGQQGATGNRNSAMTTQRGFNNSSSISQTGTIAANGGQGGTAQANTATVTQGSDTANNGNNNVANIVQVRPSGSSDQLNGNSSQITQGVNSGGFNNRATSTQNGTNLTSTITQTDDNGTGVSAQNNSATVLQVGRGNTATTGTTSSIRQRKNGNIANVSLYDGGNSANSQGGSAQNTSVVTQDNTLFTTGNNSGTSSGFAAVAANNAQTTDNSPNTANSATVAITGVQNRSTVNQDGVQNTVDQAMLTGGGGNTSATNASAQNPGTGAAYPANRSEGNSSTVTQTGRGNYAATSIGGAVTTGGGRGNISTITQAQPDSRVTQTTLNSTLTANTGHRALVFQRGLLDQSTINQSNNMLGGNSAGTTQNTQSGSLADVAQLSFNSVTNVTQVGTNTAMVTQGSRTETTGANDVMTINQTDAGDTTTTSGGTSGGFGGSAGSTSTVATRNYVQGVQYGIENTATVTQNGINASATVYQAVGTRGNTINVQQGTQSTAVMNNNNVAGFSANQNTAQQDAGNNTFNTQNVTATAYQTSGQAGTGNALANNGNNNAQAVGIGIAQSGRNLTAVANQQGGMAGAAGTTLTNNNTTSSRSSFNSILIGQANVNSSATVNQNGLGLVATVEQRGNFGTTARPNLVTITQTGGGTTAATANVALARQTQNAGASVDTDVTAGIPGNAAFPNSRSGANSAEIVIMQSGTGQSGTIEQRGRGQYASLTQSGSGNTGRILQDTGATNAVALLTQSGSGNTYNINQTMQGQYLNVVQNGNSNITTFQNGPTGNGGGGQMGVGTTDTGAAMPTFGGTQ